jgi:hypothetical protein
MTKDMDAAAVLAGLWERIGRQDWDRLPDLLHPEVQVRYVHSGEVFDRDGIVALNRDYPGAWLVDVEEIVADGPRAVSRALVYNDDATHFVASFARVEAGRITELTEVWAEAGQLPHPSRIS